MYSIEANSLTPKDVPQLNRMVADLGRGEPREHPWPVYQQINAHAVVYVARGRANAEAAGELVGMGILNIDYKAPPPFFR